MISKDLTNRVSAAGYRWSFRRLPPSDSSSLFESLNARFQVRYVFFQVFHMVGMEALVSGLVEGNLTHEFAEIIKTLFYPSEARVGLIQPPIRLIQPFVGLVQPLIRLVQPLIEVLSQLFDAISDLLQDLGGKVGSHSFRGPDV